MKSKEIWNWICQRRLSYACVASLWLLPIVLMGLPKYLEKDVIFKPGQGKEHGYICYPFEISANGTSEKMRWLTRRQYRMNIFNDVFLLVIIVSSIILIWYKLDLESKNAKEHLSIDFSKTLKDIETKARKRSLRNAALMICVPYILLRLPIFIYGQTDATDFVVLSCIFLYELQFCIHFVIFAFIHNDYLSAYKDSFNFLLMKCNYNTN